MLDETSSPPSVTRAGIDGPVKKSKTTDQTGLERRRREEPDGPEKLTDSAEADNAEVFPYMPAKQSEKKRRRSCNDKERAQKEKGEAEGASALDEIKEEIKRSRAIIRVGGVHL